MNLPNKLTMLRILLIPVFMVVLYWDFPGATWVAVAIFIVASFTDLLAGAFADEHDLRRLAAVPKHHMGPGVRQRAAPADATFLF